MATDLAIVQVFSLGKFDANPFWKVFDPIGYEQAKDKKKVLNPEHDGKLKTVGEIGATSARTT